VDPLQLVLDRGAARVTRINDTTRDAVQGMIADGVANGLTVLQIADAIEAGIPAFDAYRSELIARTEVMDVYNAAALATYGEAGIEMVEAIDGDQDEECIDRVARNPYTIDEADAEEDHPNGTLDWVPVMPNEAVDLGGAVAEEVTPVEEAVAPEEVAAVEPPPMGLDLGQADRTDQRAWLDRYYPKDSLLKPELIEGYTGGEDYAVLNSYARGFYTPPETSGLFGPATRATLDRRIELMREELANNPLPTDMRLYRSLSIDWENETSPINILFNGPGDVGASGIDKGFVSASLRADIQQTIEGEYLMVLDVPAGTPAVGATSVSSHPGEMEVILGDNLTYTVYARDGDTIYVRVSR
jgi:hypothetical protein